MADRAAMAAAWIILILTIVFLNAGRAGNPDAPGPAARAAGLRAGILAGLSASPARPETEARALLAAHAPLDPLPYAAGLATGGGAGAGSAWAKAALQRAPRNRAAWMALADEALRANDPAGAVTALSRLYHLDPAGRSTHLGLLASLAGDPAYAPALAGLAAEDELIRRPLGQEILRRGHDRSLQLAVLAWYPEGREAFLAGLTRQGLEAEAWIAFLSFLTPQERAGLTSPADPEFRGMSELAPFTWTLSRAHAAREPGGGVSVTHTGGRTAALLSQVISLSPGRYELKVVHQGELLPGGNGFRWRLACPGEAPALSADVRELTGTPRTLTAPFEIGSGACRFQRLELLGIAGLYPRPARALVRSVRVEPAAVT